MAHDLRQPIGGYLARSARTAGVVDQALLAAEKEHGAVALLPISGLAAE
jgi:hypothetical protein